MTFSLIARCARTGQFGMVISSSRPLVLSPAVAARCAHVRAGVGAVASQNITDPALGPEALDHLARGDSALEALAAVTAGRAHIEYRQLLVIDAAGERAIYSGARMLGLWGEALGKDCAAAGNLLADAAVPKAMVAAFEQATGHLGDRLMAALTAGLAAGGMAPTSGGRDLISQAAPALDAARHLTIVAGRHTGTVQGALRVGCLSTFAQIVVPQLRKTFLNAHPDVDFRQFEMRHLALFDGLRDASIDIALTYDLSIPTDLEFEGLAVLPPFAILPETHPLADRPSVSASDLAPFPMILLDLPLSADYFLSIFDAVGLKPRIAARTQDMAVVRSLVGNDLGYAIANARPLSGIAPDGKALRFVPMTGAKPLRMGLLSAAGGESSLTVQAFAVHCHQMLTDEVLTSLTVRGTP